MAGAVRKALSGDGFAAAFCAISVALALAFAFPQPAFAGIAEDINAWLCGILRDTCNWIFAGQADMLRSIGADGVLAADFAQMLGSAGDVTMYDLVRGVWQAAILPIGCGMLSLVFTVQLIKVSQRMDGNASMPGVKEVVFMLVFFAVFLFLIQNSFDLMQAVYQVVQLAIDRVTGLFGTGSELDLSEVSITTTDDDRGGAPGDARRRARELGPSSSSPTWVALVVSWARAIQIYVMGRLQPHPACAHLARRDEADGVSGT